MLLEFTIENYILVDRLHFSLEKGFSVITGETGAGKSIFLQALDLLLGGRLMGSFHKDKTQKIRLEGVFTLNDKTLLDHYGINYDQEDFVVVRREIDPMNRSLVRVNDQLVTLEALRDILKGQVDIHSQWNSLRLFDENDQISYLDALHQDQALVEAVDQAYQDWKKCLGNELELKQNHLSPIELSILKDQVKELGDARLDPLEEDKIKDQIKAIKSFSKDKDLWERALSDLQEMSLSGLSQLASHANIDTSLKELIYNFFDLQEDLLHQISDQDSQKDSDIEGDLDQLNLRSYQLSQLKRKYGMTIKGLIDYLHKSKDTLDRQENREALLIEANQKSQKAYDHFKDLASKLSDKRREAGRKLQADLVAEGRTLALKNLRFDVEWTPKEGPHGLEMGRFLIATNPNSPLGPLAKVASGGELSRLMLALKYVLSKVFPAEVMIFDEIDSGVSGKVADLMARKMFDLSKDRSVIAISHLALVAAYGQHHYKIEKKDGTTQIHLLDEKDSIKELALLMNKDLSEASLALAKELKDHAHGVK